MKQKTYQWAALLAALFTLPTSGDIAPGTCTPGSNGSNATLAPSSPGPFSIGQVIGYKVILNNPTLDRFGDPGCTISNAFVNLRLPSGDIIPVLTNIVLLPGQKIICPGAPECLSGTRAALLGTENYYTNQVGVETVSHVNLRVPQCPPEPGTNSVLLAYTTGGAIVFNNPGKSTFGTATYNRCYVTCRCLCL